MGSSKEGKIKSAPAFTITGRTKPKSPPIYPGPGAYDGEYEAVKKRQPIYSMGMRLKMTTENYLKPGPGAHCPEKSNLIGHVPSYSFGIKHSQYLGNFHDLQHSELKLNL